MTILLYFRILASERTKSGFTKMTLLYGKNQRRTPILSTSYLQKVQKMRPAYVRRIYRPAETRGAGFGVRTAAQKSTGYFTATASISTSAPIGSAAT